MDNLKIYCENDYKKWSLDYDWVIEIAGKIFNFYLSVPEIKENCCLKGYNYKFVSFDFLFCDDNKTHQINKEYRQKDYPADIITFAIFADSPENERFIQEFEINLGEIIISLEKMIEGAKEKGVARETELAFFISHGIMHLLGFDHQSEEEFEFVISKQKQALESIDIYYDKI